MALLLSPFQANPFWLEIVFSSEARLAICRSQESGSNSLVISSCIDVRYVDPIIILLDGSQRAAAS